MPGQTNQPLLVEYRVKPAGRFIITRFEQRADGTKATVEKGTFDRPELAYEVAYALCKDEHDRLGWPPGDERIQYPKGDPRYPEEVVGSHIPTDARVERDRCLGILRSLKTAAGPDYPRVAQIALDAAIKAIEEGTTLMPTTHTTRDMRAKMRITDLKRFNARFEPAAADEPAVQENLTFHAVYKDGAYPSDGSDEDNSFARFTPSAGMSMTIANPALIGKFKIGDTFYLDFHRVSG